MTEHALFAAQVGYYFDIRKGPTKPPKWRVLADAPEHHYQAVHKAYLMPRYWSREKVELTIKQRGL